MAHSREAQTVLKGLQIGEESDLQPEGGFLVSKMAMLRKAYLMEKKGIEVKREAFLNEANNLKTLHMDLNQTSEPDHFPQNKACAEERQPLLLGVCVDLPGHKWQLHLFQEKATWTKTKWQVQNSGHSSEALLARQGQAGAL